MQRLKNWTIGIIIIGGVLALVPLWTYLEHFAVGEKFSSSKEDWGTFGDFVGGTINPIISIINLALVVAISIFVARFDSHRQFNEYRNKVYFELCAKFEETENTSDSLNGLGIYLERYKLYNQFLFPGKSNSIFNLILGRLIEDTKALELDREENEEGVNLGTTHNLPVSRKMIRELLAALPPVETESSRKHRAFYESQERLIGFIQAVMIEKNIDIYIPIARPVNKR
jgi:hypothetical protein